MNGLFVREPYASRIINGEKKYEFRNYNTKKINEPILLLTKNCSLGIIKIIRTQQIDKDYKFAWRVSIIEKFNKPKKYTHPNGAVSWVLDVKLK